MSEVASDHLRTQVKLTEGGSGQIRIFETQNGRAQKIFAGTELVREVQDTTDLYAEVRRSFHQSRQRSLTRCCWPCRRCRWKRLKLETMSAWWLFTTTTRSQIERTVCRSALCCFPFVFPFQIFEAYGH